METSGALIFFGLFMGSLWFAGGIVMMNMTWKNMKHVYNEWESDTIGKKVNIGIMQFVMALLFLLGVLGTFSGFLLVGSVFFGW